MKTSHLFFPTGIFGAIYAFIFYKFIAPDVVREMLDMVRQNIMTRSPELTDEQLDQAMNMTSKFMTPPVMSIFLIIYCLIVAAIAGLITSAFLKKDDKSASPVI